MEVWEREIIYLSLRCHHQNDFFIKMGRDESHFNVSLTVRDKVTRQCPQATTFEEKGEPTQIRTEVPLLTNLTPYRQAKPAHQCWFLVVFGNEYDFVFVAVCFFLLFMFTAVSCQMFFHVPPLGFLK